MTVYHKTLGGHIHMRLFMNGGKMGDLCIRVEEWARFQSCFTTNTVWVDETVA